MPWDMWVFRLHRLRIMRSLGFLLGLQPDPSGRMVKFSWLVFPRPGGGEGGVWCQSCGWQALFRWSCETRFFPFAGGNSPSPGAPHGLCIL